MKDDTSQTIAILEGELDRIAYFNAENHFTIAKIRPFNTSQVVTVVGHMANVRPGPVPQMAASRAAPEIVCAEKPVPSKR